MFIFATVGNHPMPFDRLIKELDSIAEKSKHEFFLQIGISEYKPRYIPYMQFLNSIEMATFIDKADLIITHGGWGTIEECLERGKKIIAVPRIIGKEHYHSQEDIVFALEKQGNILGVYDINKLNDMILHSEYFVPVPLIKGNATSIINDFLKSI